MYVADNCLKELSRPCIGYVAVQRSKNMLLGKANIADEVFGDPSQSQEH
jgi:hypothetical protein